MERRKGTTFAGPLIICAVMAIIALILLISFARGNFWFTPSGVLAKVQLQDPNVEKIVDTERNLYHCSKFIVRNKEGKDSTYYLDTNILFSYRVFKKNN
jgi:hypothetical protein